MAMAINSSPLLTGESARAFVEEAERNAQRPTRRLSVQEEARLKEMDRKSQEYALIIKELIHESKRAI